MVLRFTIVVGRDYYTQRTYKFRADLYGSTSEYHTVQNHKRSIRHFRPNPSRRLVHQNDQRISRNILRFLLTIFHDRITILKAKMRIGNSVIKKSIISILPENPLQRLNGDGQKGRSLGNIFKVVFLIFFSIHVFSPPFFLAAKGHYWAGAD